MSRIRRRVCTRLAPVLADCCRALRQLVFGEGAALQEGRCQAFVVRCHLRHILRKETTAAANGQPACTAGALELRNNAVLDAGSCGPSRPRVGGEGRP